MNKHLYIQACLICLMLIPNCCFPAGDSAAVEVLRSKLKYKFVLDFLRKEKPETTYLDEDMKSQLFQGDPFVFRINKVDSQYELESFNYYVPCTLYGLKSFGDDERVYVMAMYALGFRDLFLFDCDDRHNAFLGHYDARGAREFTIDSINNHQVIRMVIKPLGIGFYTEEEEIIGIVQKKFKLLFSFNDIKAVDSNVYRETNSENWIRTMSNVKFIDINNDGFQDIVKESIEDIIHPNGDPYEEFRDAKVISHVETWETKFLWDNNSYSFVKIE